MTNLDIGAVMVSRLIGELSDDSYVGLKFLGIPAVLGVCSPLSRAELGDWWGLRSH